MLEIDLERGYINCVIKGYIEQVKYNLITFLKY